MDKYWDEIQETMNSTQMVDAFVDKVFPMKQIQVGPADKPYFMEELRQLKRKRQRAYQLHGRRNSKYKSLKQSFDLKLLNEAKKYQTRIENEVVNGKRWRRLD